MNTSHNKNRIIEFGWKNVLTNLVGMSPQPVEGNEESRVHHIQDTKETIPQKIKTIKSKDKENLKTHPASDSRKTDKTCVSLSTDVKEQSKGQGYGKGNIENHDKAILNVHSLSKQHQMNITKENIENRKVYSKYLNELKL